MSFPLLRRSVTGERTTVETPTKLNLFLELHGHRTDGYHEVETLFLALDHGDTLWIEPAPEDRLTVAGEAAPTDRTNLVWKALERARTHRAIPPLAMHLEKRVPAGTGLGGGSANAAGMLAALHDRYPDPRGESGVAEDAAALGSDLNFFLGESTAAVGRGRGEQLEPWRELPSGLADSAFCIFAPKLHSSTAEAYRGISYPLTSPNGPITFPARTFEDLGEWQRGLFNRLEVSVFRSLPPLADLAHRLSSWHRREWDRTPNRGGGGTESPPIADPATGSTGGSRDPRSSFSPASDDDASHLAADRRIWMTGSGSALFAAEEDRSRAEQLERAVTAPGGPIDPFRRECEIDVVTWCASPLFPNTDVSSP